LAGILRKALNTAYVIPACAWERRMPFAPPAVIRAIQIHRMRSIVRHAWKYVPFYRQSMEERGITPRDIREPGDLEALPLICNENMRDDPSIFNSRKLNPDKDMVIRTGSYKVIYWSRGAALQWFARISRTREVINNLLGKGSGYVEVYINSPVNCNLYMNQYWQSQLLFRGRGKAKIRLDANDLYEKIVAQLNRIKPDIVYCFGSFSDQLFKYIEAENLELASPGIWISGSDMMGVGTRELIESKLGCPVYSAYNMNEMGAMSFECEKRAGFHLNIDACHVRIADEQGKTLEDGKAGEVIISNLVNRATVLLNYRTGDRGKISSEACECGRNLPLLSDLYGRTSDILECGKGIAVSFGQIEAQLGEIMVGVSIYQVVQERPGHFRWMIVPLPGCDRDCVESGIRRLMDKILPGRCQMEISWVAGIDLTPSGKRKFVVHRF